VVAFCERGNEFLDAIKMRGISLLADDLLRSQTVVSAMELIRSRSNA
jgi:hypothetical protein